MTHSFHELDIRDLRKLFSIKDETALHDSFFLTEQRYEERMDVFMKEPCRFNCYLALFCIDGDFTIEINLKPIRVRKNSLIICIPGSICRVSEVDRENLGKLDVVVIAVSKELMSTIRFDFTIPGRKRMKINTAGPRVMRARSESCSIVSDSL